MDCSVYVILAHLALPPDHPSNLVDDYDKGDTNRSIQALHRFPSFCCAEQHPRSLAWPMRVIASEDVGFKARGNVSGCGICEPDCLIVRGFLLSFVTDDWDSHEEVGGLGG